MAAHSFNMLPVMACIISFIDFSYGCFTLL
ncbi:CRISPR-associated DxTHG motif protein [Planococcus glaciei]|nr:CRISPR-associated DxTHG motif protein [Planococcus glaciei]